MEDLICVEIFSLHDGERAIIIPSGFKGTKLVVFEDYAYNINVEYLTDEMYERLKRGST